MTNPIQAPLKTLRIQEPGAHRAHGWAFLRLGFRPFYMGAALFSMVAVPVWVLAWLGWLQWTPAIAPMWWHAHEMLFGFVAAVVMGFLMTAGKAWTGLPTPRGPALGALALVWLAARVALWWVPYGIYAALDFVLLPMVALILLRLLLRAGNRRNLPIAGLLGLMALSNGVFHAAVMGWLDLSPQVALYAMLSLVVLLESVLDFCASQSRAFDCIGIGGSSVFAWFAPIALVSMGVSYTPYVVGFAAGLCVVSRGAWFVVVGDVGLGFYLCGSSCFGGRCDWSIDHGHDHAHSPRTHRTNDSSIQTRGHRFWLAGICSLCESRLALGGTTANDFRCGGFCNGVGAGIFDLFHHLWTLACADTQGW